MVLRKWRLAFKPSDTITRSSHADSRAVGAELRRQSTLRVTYSAAKHPPARVRRLASAPRESSATRLLRDGCGGFDRM
jgi:hypothetical protein